jgi:heat shock protein HslJ
MKQALMAASAAAGLISLGGCSSTPARAESPPLDGTAWILSLLPGLPVSGRSPTAQFEGTRILGTDGCNRFSVPYTTRGASIEIGSNAAMTQMACEPEIMRQAEAYMAALGGARSYRISGGQLQLLGADGKALATFAAQEQSLAGTSWRATGINNGKGAVGSLVADSSVTMAFGADGRASGSAGCNNFGSGYQAEGSALRFTPAAATRRMCGAAGVMEQEQAFFRALESVSTMRIEGDRLEMRTAEGALAVALTRNPGT